MATFPDIDPTYGIAKTSAPIVRTARFGDGYEQRVTLGIQQNPKEWSMQWVNLSETNADTIEDFLNARAGVESFDWTPPDETTSYKWVCQQWSKTITNYEICTINATFRQVFEP
jgi:phage-related protein